MTDPLIFDIKRYAINDGPGIRIVIFFKGCNLNCAWCHNPEGIAPGFERMYAPARCIKCGSCVMACPEKAIRLTPDGIITDEKACKMETRCAEVCPSKALEISGKYYSVKELTDIIERERVFIEQSNGGVTFSGGEPLLHPAFLMKLLDACKKKQIHRAIDTAGFVNTDILLEAARHTDLFLYDLKHMDSEMHKKWTGVPNEKILANLQLLASTGVRIIVRIPLIGGVNDDEKNMHQSAKFIADLAGEKKEVNLLPYHKIAQTKYAKLGRPDDFMLLMEPAPEAQQKALEIFGEYGLHAGIGG
ncbi:MAG: glycyl-radical enzyme activating protein [Bacteroidales bacterium]